MEQAQRVEKFLGDNPDYKELSTSTEFYNWANASEYRTRQLNAAKEGDLEAAGDILQGYREQAGARQEAAKKGEKVKRDKALAEASTETAGTGQTPGKIWKKAELRNLLLTDPDKYYAMDAEIMKAYEEGRVK